MVINNITLNNFRNDVEGLLKELESKYGVKIECGGATYSLDKFTLKLNVSNVGEDGIDAETKRALDSLDWFKNIYGKRFIDGKHTFKVVGYEYNKKYSVRCERDDGKIMCFVNRYFSDDVNFVH